MTMTRARSATLSTPRIAASKAGDVPALMDLMTDDVIFMTPGRPPFGRAEFAADADA